MFPNGASDGVKKYAQLGVELVPEELRAHLVLEKVKLGKTCAGLEAKALTLFLRESLLLLEVVHEEFGQVQTVDEWVLGSMSSQVGSDDVRIVTPIIKTADLLLSLAFLYGVRPACSGDSASRQFKIQELFVDLIRTSGVGNL